MDSGAVTRAEVMELGAVLTQVSNGRRNDDEMALFDATGPAIQELAIAKVAYAKIGELDLQTIDSRTAVASTPAV
jgi:ornithine cyclodeaminase/alanine dehydrogenase-like protein (mu-crystallin family)